MKRVIVTAAACAAIFASQATLAAAPTERYASAQLSLADVSGLDSGLAVTANYGMPMTALLDDATIPPKLRDKLFFEAEGSITVASPSRTIAGVKAKTSYFTVGAYAVYRQQLRNGASVHGRAGLLYEHADATASVGGTSVSGTDSSTEFSYGVGFNYPLKQDMNLRADYTVVDTSGINHLSVGIQMPLH